MANNVKVNVYNSKGELVNKFNSQTEAGEAYNLTARKVCTLTNKGIATNMGFKFVRITEPMKKYTKKITKKYMATKGDIQIKTATLDAMADKLQVNKKELQTAFIFDHKIGGYIITAL